MSALLKFVYSGFRHQPTIYKEAHQVAHYKRCDLTADKTAGRIMLVKFVNKKNILRTCNVILECSNAQQYKYRMLQLAQCE